jgi:hypothetical protein
LPLPTASHTALSSLQPAIRLAGETNTLERVGGVLAQQTFNKHGKRAVEVVDLSHLATEDPSPPPQATAKRQKRQGSATTAQVRAERIERLEHESSVWRTKYLKAFPTFVFYFDQIDANVQLELQGSIEKLGGVSVMCAVLL